MIPGGQRISVTGCNARLHRGVHSSCAAPRQTYRPGMHAGPSAERYMRLSTADRTRESLGARSAIRRSQLSRSRGNTDDTPDILSSLQRSRCDRRWIVLLSSLEYS